MGLLLLGEPLLTSLVQPQGLLGHPQLVLQLHDHEAQVLVGLHQPQHRGLQLQQVIGHLVRAALGPLQLVIEGLGGHAGLLVDAFGQPDVVHIVSGHKRAATVLQSVLGQCGGNHKEDPDTQWQDR